jgi:IclR family transcriptional regulator, acetate operon repressor
MGMLTWLHPRGIVFSIVEQNAIKRDEMPVNSVMKAIDIISLFSPEEPRLTLTEISRRLAMPKSTAHNLLNTLLTRGLIERVDNDSYALGMAIIALTQAVRVNVELRDRAAPLLRQLADRAHLSVYLTVLDGDRCLYIYAVESSRRLLARTAIGDRAMLHCTSVGKAMLAFLPEAQMEGILEDAGLPAYTPATLTDPERLREDLGRIRTRGYATDAAEHERGTYCIGAPIFNEKGTVIGACSVSGVETAILGERLEELSRLVVQTADEISRRMGYVAATPALIAAWRG